MAQNLDVSTEKPLISFVGYSRNDGYARNFERRLQLTVNSLAHQAARFEVVIEFLLVEWNPPNENPPIASLFDTFKDNPFFRLRVITVPGEYHKGVRGEKEKGLHPVRALNVGFRRARGRFVSPIASDVVISDAVFEYFNSHGLSDMNVYRLDRVDVDETILERLDVVTISPADIVRAVEGAQLVRHRQMDEELAYHYGLQPLHTNACGDFLLMPIEMLHAVRGYKDCDDVACLDVDAIMLHAVVVSGLCEKRLPDECVVNKLAHDQVCRLRVRPYRPVFRRGIEKLINSLIFERPFLALIRAVFDVPRRQVEGLSGDFPSMEKNLVLPARLWAKRKKQVRLNGQDWGLAGVNLPEQEL